MLAAALFLIGDIKIKNPAYSQKEGREELSERGRTSA
jgi:hypothetical protein